MRRVVPVLVGEIRPTCAHSEHVCGVVSIHTLGANMSVKWYPRRFSFDFGLCWGRSGPGHGSDSIGSTPRHPLSHRAGGPETLHSAVATVSWARHRCWQMPKYLGMCLGDIRPTGTGAQMSQPNMCLENHVMGTKVEPSAKTYG